jgi:hypothetical protein
MTTLNFTEADPTEVFDTVPSADDVEYPCETCGRESGPYSGRGRKPRFCTDHKPKRQAASGVRVTGKANDMAAQAAKTLSSINGIIALAAGSFGFLQTMGAIFDRNEDFEKTAYAALVTDPKLARQILSVGETSAKLTLGMAYLSMGAGIAPILASEYKLKKEARLVEMNENGG